MKAKLTARQKAFIAEYLVCLNATKAAELAGYSAKTAKVQGSRLLTNVAICAELEKRQTKKAEQLELSRDYVLNGIMAAIESCKNPFHPAIFKGYELLGKHLKLFIEKHEHSFDQLGMMTDEQLAAFASRIGLDPISIASGGTA